MKSARVHKVLVEKAWGSMPDYRHELRRGEVVVATGHFSRERPLEIGERVAIGRQSGIVRSIEPLLGKAGAASGRAALA